MNIIEFRKSLSSDDFDTRANALLEIIPDADKSTFPVLPKDIIELIIDQLTIDNLELKRQTTRLILALLLKDTYRPYFTNIGIITQMVSQLHSTDLGLKRLSTLALAKIACDQVARLSMAVAIPQIIEQLQIDDLKLKQYSTHALVSLSLDRQYTTIISTATPLLIEQLRIDDLKLKERSTHVLANLGRNRGYKAMMGTATPLLIQQLRTDSLDLKLYSTRALLFSYAIDQTSITEMQTTIPLLIQQLDTKNDLLKHFSSQLLLSLLTNWHCQIIFCLSKVDKITPHMDHMIQVNRKRPSHKSLEAAKLNSFFYLFRDIRKIVAISHFKLVSYYANKNIRSVEKLKPMTMWLVDIGNGKSPKPRTIEELNLLPEEDGIREKLTEFNRLYSLAQSTKAPRATLTSTPMFAAKEDERTSACAGAGADW